MLYRILLLTYTLTLFVHQIVGQNSDGNEKPSDIDTINLYYYPNSQNVTERYVLSDASSFKDVGLKKGKRLKLVIHGANGDCFNSGVPITVVEAYLRAKAAGREDYNVMCLDYGPLARPLGPVPGEPSIPSIKKRYEYVCDLVAEKASGLILTLVSERYIYNLTDIHLIGHSLGGQLSGFIGRKIQEKTNYEAKLGRITGLDIMNIFYVYNAEVKLGNQLDLSDSHFVDIVHTSPIGLKGDYGHVDFYPDGGLHQQSCLQRGPVSNVTEMIIGSCSHIIVGRYWANSIDDPNLKACKDGSWESYSKRRSSDCEDEVIFGEYVPTSTRGRYYFKYPLVKV